jgi:hypothetical protein
MTQAHVAMSELPNGYIGLKQGVQLNQGHPMQMHRSTDGMLISTSRLSNGSMGLMAYIYVLPPRLFEVCWSVENPHTH